jgi:polyhydroxyalkanoate synthase
MSDLMAWNADATRMPARMHTEYLRRLFLRNDLAEGRFRAGGRPVALSDIRVPIFAVGTEHDHVAPWRSAYKIRLLTDTDVTFLLASGGHNTGIVSPPPAGHRHYRASTQAAHDRHLDAATWEATAPLFEGSWWPAWTQWLAERSGAPVPPPKSAGAGQRNLPAAPGRYVLQA